MNRNLVLAATAFMFVMSANAQRTLGKIRENVPLDSIRLSDPAILADKSTSMYYMTGTGGKMWKSKDLRLWSGPYDVVKVDSTS